MRYSVLIIAFVLYNSVNAQTSSLNKDSLQFELEIYREILNHAHTGINLYTSNKEFDVLFNKLQNDLDKIQTLKEYYLRLAEIHTRINCGHSSMYYSLELGNDFTRSIIPFSIKFLGKEAFIEVSHCDIPAGSQIISINSNTIDHLTAKSFKIISSDGYNTTFKYRQLEQDFYFYYSIFYPLSNLYTVEYIDYETQLKKTITVKPLSLESLSKKSSSPPSKVYNLELINENTALLTVNSFSTPSLFSTWKYFSFSEESIPINQAKRCE